VTCSDSTHPRLFIESKLRERHTVRTLHDATKRLAAREGKVPVLTLFDKGRPGCLVVVHSDDLAAVLAEYAAARQRDDERSAETDFQLAGFPASLGLADRID
jgi:hypothetical protein